MPLANPGQIMLTMNSFEVSAMVVFLGLLSWLI
jgi:hypothetical protein